jgi:hypothetical protein
MQPHELLNALYASEINCRIESFFNDGWIGWLGDEMNGFEFARVRGDTFPDCVRELAAPACAVYAPPDPPPPPGSVKERLAGCPKGRQH